MPTKPKPQDLFIQLFVSAYEDGSWADAQMCWLDQKIDGAVELLATRKSDLWRLSTRFLNRSSGTNVILSNLDKCSRK